MSRIAGLQRRIDRMLEQLEPRRLPKTWLLILEAGQAIPDRLYPLLAPYDRIVTREIPAAFLGPDSEPTFYSY